MVTMTSSHNQIVLANQAFMTAFANSDAGAVARCYCEDGQILPAQSEPITGRPGIEAFWHAVMEMGIKSGSLETIEVFECADGACEIGRYSMALASGQVADHGKYVVIWHVEDGAMKLYRDIWNTSVPAAT